MGRIVDEVVLHERVDAVVVSVEVCGRDGDELAFSCGRGASASRSSASAGPELESAATSSSIGSELMGRVSSWALARR